MILPLLTHNSESIVRQHLDFAGRYCGLGAWRKHGYGRFKVLKVKKLRDVKPIKLPSKFSEPIKEEKEEK
jgi:hypothetical protein